VLATRLFVRAKGLWEGRGKKGRGKWEGGGVKYKEQSQRKREGG
jgi:hypothetical protein